MSNVFWDNKTVLLTGHTGFKGSWLSLWLQELGANVVGYALAPSTTPDLFTLADVSKNMVSIIGDIRDYESMNNIFLEHQPDIIFHLAAQPLVRFSYEHPIETYSTNVMGTLNVLEAARTLKKCKAIVNVTTDKCYENKEWYWGYREEDKLGGHDPYSSSKACAELITSAYRTSFYQHEHCGLATARAGNVIGGGDWASNRLIPDVIEGIFKNEHINLRYPNALRPWQHVLEPLQGYLQLAEALYSQPEKFSEAWNFGPQDSEVKPVNWIVEKMIQLSGKNLHWQTDNLAKFHEATYLKLDSSKSINKLGWRSRWDLEKTLEETINWYRAYELNENMYKKTISQIRNYGFIS